MKFSKAITSFLVLATTVESVVINTIPQFTKTINNEIVCEKVVEQHQLLQKTNDIKDGVVGKSRFVCVVKNEYTPSGEAYGIKLSMNDIDESFHSAFTAAKKTGHTELWIKNPLVEGSSVKLPSAANEKSSSATSFSGSLFHKEVIEAVERIGGGRALRSSSQTMKSKTCYSPHMQWRKPKDTLTQNRRNLAVNQTGSRSVIVFRVKVGTSQLTNSAAEISEEMFSTTSNIITLASQMKACSYGQLIFVPSTSSSFTFLEDGVVEVTFTSEIFKNTDQATDIENAIKTLYGSAMNNVDHKVYAVPPNTQNEDGVTDWLAYADFPGDESTYRDWNVINVSTQMHEFGHNLGLAHSGDTFNGVKDEYEDETCNMGYGENDDHSICWNAAKSAELGWYDDRVTTIYPHAGDEFDGRLIGVNDYGISSLSDTLVLEIKNSDSSVNSYFLMYNKKEGINDGAEEAIDQIVIVQGATSEQSWRVAEITPGSSWTEANYFLDKTLVISTQVEASSDNVLQYVRTTIKFQDKSCLSDNDCSSLPTCFSEQCSSNVCEIVRDADCCGNELCDDSEFCNTCDDCLQNSDHCTNLDASYWIGANTDFDEFGTSFDVTASTNIYIHEIDAFVWVEKTSYPVKVYTRSGTNTVASNLNNWEKVFDGSITSDAKYFVTIPLSSRVDVSSGSTQAFYIDMTGSLLDYKVAYEESEVNTQSNNDITISTLTVRKESSGTTIGDAKGTSAGFVGMVKYGYAKSSTDEDCNDSPLRVKVWNENQQRYKMQSCDWIGRIESKVEERCATTSVNGETNAAHCAKTCGVTNCSQQDSNSRFKVENPKNKKLLTRYCTFAANNPEERCTWVGMADTCRATCAEY